MKQLLMFLLTCFVFHSAYAICKIKVRTAKVSVGENSLKYIIHDDGSWSGLTIDLTKALLEEAGCQYTFHPMPWKRALADLEDGHIDMMMNFSFNKDREKFAYYIGPMDEEKMILIVQKKSNYQINSLEDFKKIPVKFSFERGAYLGKVFDNKLKTDPEFKKKFSQFSGGDITNYERLALGRMGGFIADKYEVAIHLKKFPQLIVHPFTINHDWVYWGISRKSVSAETILKLYQAYIRLKDKKSLEQIVHQYAKLQ